MLVALRIWQPLWSKQRLNLSAKGDHIGALALLLEMTPHSARHDIIARELALLTIQSPFCLEMRHTPGVAHVVADELSGAFAPGRAGGGFTHHALSKTVRIDCPARESLWFQANLGQTSFA